MESIHPVAAGAGRADEALLLWETMQVWFSEHEVCSLAHSTSDELCDLAEPFHLHLYLFVCKRIYVNKANAFFFFAL